MCRLHLLLACIAVSSPFSPPAKNSACNALAGTYEGFTTRLAVHEDHMYMAQANSVTHSKGSIVASTDCSCSGIVNFTGTEMFNWQYNLWTCELKWTKNPTREKPHVEEVSRSGMTWSQHFHRSTSGSVMAPAKGRQGATQRRIWMGYVWCP